VQEREAIAPEAAAESVIEAVRDMPLRVAVSVADWLVVIDPAFAVKVIAIEPEGTVTEADETGSSALLVEIATTVPLVGAALVRVTVQVVTPPEYRSVGLHARELRAAGATKLTVAVLDTPLRVALSVAAWLLAIVPAVAVKVAEDDPAWTFTDVLGTGRSELLLDTDTAVPPDGAGPLSATVHVVVPSESRLVGLHVNELRATGGTKLRVAVWGIPAGTVAKASSEYALCVPELLTAVVT
jgi:hypothetical protein